VVISSAVCCFEGSAQPRPDCDDPVILVVESPAVHARADGDQRAEGQVARSQSQGHPTGSNRAETRGMLHARRLRHHHLHHAAGRSVPRAADVAHLQVRRPQLHKHVLHVQEHSALFTTNEIKNIPSSSDQ